MSLPFSAILARRNHVVFHVRKTFFSKTRDFFRRYHKYLPGYIFFTIPTFGLFDFSIIDNSVMPKICPDIWTVSAFSLFVKMVKFKFQMPLVTVIK